MTYVLAIGGPIVGIAIVGAFNAWRLNRWKRKTPEGRGYAAMEDLVKEAFRQFDKPRRKLDK